MSNEPNQQYPNGTTTTDLTGSLGLGEYRAVREVLGRDLGFTEMLGTFYSVFRDNDGN